MDITGGDSSIGSGSFNEAVGYYRRKPTVATLMASPTVATGASMRPSDITDRKPMPPAQRWIRLSKCFNEAVGYYRRKQGVAPRRSLRAAEADASMRPSDITDGNMPQPDEHGLRPLTYQRFNEAVGYYRRKLSRSRKARRVWTRFNEAVGYYRRKLHRRDGRRG